MQCPKCDFPQKDPQTECSKCGFIFSKYQKNTVVSAPNKNDHCLTEPDLDDVHSLWKYLLLDVPPETNLISFGARVGLFLVLLIWGGIFIFSSIESGRAMNSMLHMVNLPFHEAGHVFFRLCGRFMTSLGGSLLQLLMPVICGLVFLIRTRDTFGSSVCVWWLGENFMDLAPYINDAQTLKMPLLGGNTGESSPYGFHDWEYILTETGLLRYDHTIAHFSYGMGIFFMFLAIVWSGYLLFKQYQNL